MEGRKVGGSGVIWSSSPEQCGCMKQKPEHTSPGRMESNLINTGTKSLDGPHGSYQNWNHYCHLQEAKQLLL